MWHLLYPERVDLPDCFAKASHKDVYDRLVIQINDFWLTPLKDYEVKSGAVIIKALPFTNKIEDVKTVSFLDLHTGERYQIVLPSMLGLGCESNI